MPRVWQHGESHKRNVFRPANDATIRVATPRLDSRAKALTPPRTRWRRRATREFHLNHKSICGRPPPLPGAARRSGLQRFPKLFSSFFPSFSKYFAWILQAFPNISFAVLWNFNGLQGTQASFMCLQIYVTGRSRENWTRAPRPDDAMGRTE